MNLPEGVVTPGWFDTRPAVPRVPLPVSLAGKRGLDVGTWDGFWAFEMERRGAAEVLATARDAPAGGAWPANASAPGLKILEQFKEGAAGFELAHHALGSKVTRRDLSVYDLDPAET